MAFALWSIGAVLLIAAVRDKVDGSQGLFTLVKGDFSGGYFYWVLAILVIGSIGYIPRLKTISNALLGLIVLVLVLTKGNPTAAGGGFFQKFTQGIGVDTQTNQNSTSSSGMMIPAISAIQPLTPLVQ